MYVINCDPVINTCNIDFVSTARGRVTSFTKKAETRPTLQWYQHVHQFKFKSCRLIIPVHYKEIQRQKIEEEIKPDHHHPHDCQLSTSF